MALPRVEQIGATVPLVDLAGLYDDDLATARAIAAKLVAAGKSWGFLYVINHGVEQAQVDRMFALARQFFALPLAARDAVSMVHSESYRGYLPFDMMGGDQKIKGNLHEGFQIFGEPSIGDVMHAENNPLIAPNPWPAELPALRVEMLAYFDAVSALSMRVLTLFAIGLDLPDDTFTQHFEWPMSQCRMLHYPPQDPADNGERPGTRPHTDQGPLTFLAQDETGGLEVLSQGGTWVGVPPLRGSFVVNIGEMLKIWTDGTLASTPHRVINRHGVDRYSLPFFAIPDFDALIAPMMQNAAAVDEPQFETTVERGKVLTSGEILLQVYKRIWPSATLQRAER